MMTARGSKDNRTMDDEGQNRGVAGSTGHMSAVGDNREVQCTVPWVQLSRTLEEQL